MIRIKASSTVIFQLVNYLNIHYESKTFFIHATKTSDIEYYIRSGIHTAYQSCHKKSHLNICGWVGFLTWCFICGNLTLFEIPHKSFFMLLSVKIDTKKIQQKYIYIFFNFLSLVACAILHLCLFSIFHTILLDCVILRKYLYVCIFTDKKHLLFSFLYVITVNLLRAFLFPIYIWYSKHTYMFQHTYFVFYFIFEDAHLY